jgi:hypothetical protein
MSIRKSIFALAAIATLGTSALAPTSASAFGGHFGGGHFGGHIGGFGHFGGHVWGHGFGSRFGGHFWGHGFGPRFGSWRPGPICHWGCGYPGRYHWWPRFGFGYRGAPVYGSGVGPSATYAAPVSAPAPARGCLTKQELPDGTALFQDLCTQEQAETQPQGAPQEMPQGMPRGRFPRGS